MNLKKTEVDEINAMLKNPKILIPVYRRTVGYSGANYEWLQKNILTKNSAIPERLRTLLHLPVQ